MLITTVKSVFKTNAEKVRVQHRRKYSNYPVPYFNNLCHKDLNKILIVPIYFLKNLAGTRDKSTIGKICDNKLYKNKENKKCLKNF